jgi:hypothetical protein
MVKQWGRLRVDKKYRVKSKDGMKILTTQHCFSPWVWWWKFHPHHTTIVPYVLLTCFSPWVRRWIFFLFNQLSRKIINFFRCSWIMFLGQSRKLIKIDWRGKGGNTFCLPRSLLFVYLQHPKYPFCLPVTALLYWYYLCIVSKVLFVYLFKNTSYLQPRITCLLFLRPTSTSFCLPT